MRKYLRTGVGLIGAGIVVGSIPNLSGTEAESNLKSNFSTGLGNVGSVLPAYGSIVGTGMVLKSVGHLKHSMNKFNMKLMKGGRKKRR